MTTPNSVGDGVDNRYAKCSPVIWLLLLRFGEGPVLINSNNSFILQITIHHYKGTGRVDIASSIADSWFGILIADVSSPVTYLD